MKLNNAELVAALEDEVEERYGFPYSEYDYPWETVILKVAEQGDFTLETFLRYLGFIEAIELDAYFFDFELAIIAGQSSAIKKTQQIEKSLQIEQRFRHFLTVVQTSIADLQAYTVSLKDLENLKEISTFKIIVGRCIDEYWIGIAPIVSDLNEFIFHTSSSFSLEHNQAVGKKTSELVSELKLVTHGLILPSELDRATDPIRGSIVEIAETRELLVEKLLDSAGFIQTVDVKIGGDLGELLRENLTNLRQYIIWGFFIYIMGKTEDGDWIGVSTKAVWT